MQEKEFNMKHNPECVEIMSLKFRNKTKQEYLSEVIERVYNNKKTVIFTPNPQILINTKINPKMLDILNQANILLPDGIGILIVSKLKGIPIKERVAGIDFAKEILEIAQRQKLSVFFLGGKPGVANLAAKKLHKSLPKLKICGCHHGYFDKNGKENELVKSKIKKANPDIIFVCLGSPLQERWIVKNFHSEELRQTKLAIGLGGSLDVWAGKFPRAPMLFRKIGIEWLWRIIIEPKRAKALLDIPRFLYFALTE